MARKMNKWTRFHHCTVLVINPCNNSDKQSSLLMGQYRSLSGLASLRFQGDQHLFDIAFWCSEKGVSARQQLLLCQQNERWTLSHQEETAIQPRSDENVFSATLLSLKAHRRFRNTGRFSTITKRSSTTRARHRPQRLFFSDAK